MSIFDLTTSELPELDEMIYLTGVSTPITREAGRDDLGLLATPASSVHRQRSSYRFWGADNGCFNERHPEKGKALDVARWLAWLADCGSDGCLFVTMPDVLNWVPNPDESAKQRWIPVGDMAATWERSEGFIDQVKAMGFPVAVVLQDGLEDLPEIWAQILDRADAIFVGGSDEWKLGEHAARFIREAREHGLWVHVGRVNSLKRCRIVQAMGADSADGTYVGFCPTKNAPKVIEWLDALKVTPRPTFTIAQPLPMAA